MKGLVLSILFLCFPLGPFAAQSSNIEITWFGTTCINISDGETSIFFDPFFNRPGVWDLISFQDYKGDKKIVDKWLAKIDKNRIKAIFVSHTHYDHALDLVATAKATTAKVYGSKSAKRIMDGSKLPSSRTQIIQNYQKIQVGDFKITILPGSHAPHAFGLTLGSGPIEKSLSSTSPLYKYKAGELYNYYIEHPKGVILFHPSGQTILSKKDLSKHKAELVIQGIYSRKSTKDIIDNILKPVGATQVIATHYDNFLYPLSSKVEVMPFSGFSEFKESLSKIKEIQDHDLEYGKKFIYVSKKNTSNK